MKKILLNRICLTFLIISACICSFTLSACGKEKESPDSTEIIVSCLSYKTKLEKGGYTVSQASNSQIGEINAIITSNYVAGTVTAAIAFTKDDCSGYIYELKNILEAQDFVKLINNKTIDSIIYGCRQIDNSVITSTNTSPNVVVDEIYLLLK